MITDSIIGYYDRAGRPLSLEEWAALRQFQSYRRVDVTDVGELYISTTWLGLDHSYMPGPHEPLIFETMIFQRDDDTIDYSGDEERASALHPELRALVGEYLRHSTEQEAIDAHAAICVEIRTIAARIEMARDIMIQAIERKK